MKKKLLCALLSALLLASCTTGSVNGGADEKKQYCKFCDGGKLIGKRKHSESICG